MAYNATISNGAIQNDYGSANITTLNGIQFVFATANNTTVSSGGVEVIESGGTGGFIVSAGGTFNVLAGGTATGGGVLSGGFVQDLWHDKRRHC
jgi:autotransporter passenger strand-loop-strand repeat protein